MKNMDVGCQFYLCTFSIQNQILTKGNILSPEISDKLMESLKENFQGILEKWQKNKVRKLKSKTCLNLITSTPGFISEISGLSLLCRVTDTDIDTFCSLRRSQIMKCDNPCDIYLVINLVQ